jgi:hypothetical protein
MAKRARKISVVPSRGSFHQHIAQNVIATPATNAANQAYDSRKGDSLVAGTRRLAGRP